MLMNRFLRLLQFTEHPYTKVAGEKEELLSLYFVEPRYFSEALGNARQPKSYVVFGPRGGGKSAIRAMIELYCHDEKFHEDIGGKVLCITYDDFSALNLRQLNTITLSDHINEILKRGVAQLTASLVHSGVVGDSFGEQNRGLLRWYIDEFLSNLSRVELDSILKLLQSQSEKIKELITDAAQIYNTVISVLKMEHIQPSAPVNGTPAERKHDSISSIHMMQVFVRLAQEVGFEAVYVLADKIDETDQTGGDSRKAAVLVAPLLTNIKLLELDGFALKFFVWDNVREHFGQELRADRITMKPTQWTNSDLEKMLERRIRAYSLGRTSLIDIFEPSIRTKMQSILTTLAYKSPRDLNRLMDSIFAEAAADATDENYVITWTTVLTGIERFSRERAEELYTQDIVERVMRLKKHRFTISDVASTFRITGSRDKDDGGDQTASNKARNVVEKWKSSGIAKQIEPVSIERSGRRRSVNQYEIVDPRVLYLLDRNIILVDTLESE